jgi:PadR family transcriptional regulator PadR
MNISDWLTQTRRGIVEFCILTLIKQSPKYGYEIGDILSQWEPLAVTDGTLYPLLRRLQKEKYIISVWKESISGPPRKYYHLTNSGTALLTQMEEEWGKLIGGIKELREFEKGGNENESKNESIS